MGEEQGRMPFQASQTLQHLTRRPLYQESYKHSANETTHPKESLFLCRFVIHKDAAITFRLPEESGEGCRTCV